MKRLGLSCDWSRFRFTMDEVTTRAVKEVFKSLHDKGYIYRGERMINFCPGCESALSDDEVEYKTENRTMYHVKYNTITVATVRPETIYGDVAVAVNPKDKRYAKLVGTTVTNPLTGKQIPVIADDYVDMKFGTDWTTPQRKDVKAGDVRILLAQITNDGDREDFNQAYWPILPTGMKANPITIKSPAAEATFARIAPVEEVRAKWLLNTHEPWNIHYTKLEVHLPLDVIGITGDPAGMSIGFDTSVAVSNESGDQRERAGHWAGLSESRVVDRPGSAVLLPHTWGTLMFEE